MAPPSSSLKLRKIVLKLDLLEYHVGFPLFPCSELSIFFASSFGSLELRQGFGLVLLHHNFFCLRRRLFQVIQSQRHFLLIALQNTSTYSVKRNVGKEPTFHSTFTFSFTFQNTFERREMTLH